MARWLDLTRRALPEAAPVHGWPVRHDHCFMRICLDAACGTRWDRVIRRPAIRHMSGAELEAAIAVAERLLREPASLAGLNRASLRARGHA